MNAKIAFLASVAVCGSATAEPGKYAHPELRLAAERTGLRDAEHGHVAGAFVSRRQ